MCYKNMDWALFFFSQELDEPLKHLSLEAATLPDMSLPQYKGEMTT